MQTLSDAIKAGALSVPEAAERLGVTRGRVIHLIDEGKIKVVFREAIPGRLERFWVDPEDVEREAGLRAKA